MAEYVPLYAPGKAITLVASAAITGGQLVGLSGVGTVAPTSAAAHSWIGVAGHDAATGEAVTVHKSGVQRLTTSAGVTAGQTLEAASTGRVAPHTNGTNDVNVVGLALTTASSGALVEVKLSR
ncbi:DUF2190 family protein [Microbacterium sp.]|uniref:DUF2190 family protein n=1 Tax=Microbacterium sp. TaxID=51671 RepID=UPI003F7031BA